MESHTGPSVTHTSSEVSLKDMNFVQEQLSPVGLEYALLGYTPVDPRNVMISINGALKLQGTDYLIDGRKIQFTPSLMAGNDAVYAAYATASTVATIPAVEIAFDIPGQNVRVGVGGIFQILVDGTWYDMTPIADPITGAITFVAEQDASLNQ